MSARNHTAAFVSDKYLYSPAWNMPWIVAVLVGVSCLWHVYQCFSYKFWRTMFFMVYGGVLYTLGWIIRGVSVRNPDRLILYIAQHVLLVAGPPIYAAAEYNTLGRLMLYVPMHAALNPDRTVHFFVYLGITVESLTVLGAVFLVVASGNSPGLRYTGQMLMAISLMFQLFVELLLFTLVLTIESRCKKSGMRNKNIKMLCLMLYGTSGLILLRCMMRMLEAFSKTNLPEECNGYCEMVLYKEWYLYVFDALPMVIYTWWLNYMHPAKYLPTDRHQYLDADGQTERLGPGWIDTRSKMATFCDPTDLSGVLTKEPHHEKFWLEPERWQMARDFNHRSKSDIAMRQMS